MLKQLDTGFYKDLNKKGHVMRTGLKNILSDNDLNFKVAGLSSMFQIYFTDNEVYDYGSAKSADTEKFNLYFQKLLQKGVFIPPSQFECCFISLMHDNEDIDKTLEAVDSGLKALK
jgi:glutamate-1-semialdehyde 2,1-aminomutase